MNRLIYYPTFEPSNILWLKYALLYVDNFSPIIPVQRKHIVSEVFRKLTNETDLVKPLEPTYEQGMNASLQTLSEVDKILVHPERYRDIFNHVNVARAFRDESKWDFILYEEKFNEIFRYYCLDNRVGKEVAGGISMSRQLANLYMANLADRISFDKTASPITDLPELDNLTSFLRVKDVQKDETIAAARATIQLSVPKNFDNVSFDTLIRFRNHGDSIALRNSLMSQIDNYLTHLEDSSFSSSDFIESLKKANSEFGREVLLSFGGVGAATLGAIILLREQNPDVLEVTKQVIEGTGLIIAGGYSMKKAWEADREKKDARKYLSRLGSLSN